MKRKEKQSLIVLLTREQSTMASNWTEALCLSRVRAGRWQIGRYTYQIYNIRDVVNPPEDASEEEVEEWDPFNADLPDEHNGHAVLGMVDGEYVQTDELISRDEGVVFGRKNIDEARAYATENAWSEEPDFEAAWLVLLNEVAPAAPASIRATVEIFGAGPGMGGTSYVHFRRSGDQFRVFVGGTSSDGRIELGAVTAAAGWRGRLQFLLGSFEQSEHCRVEDVRITGALGLEARMIAVAWSGPKGAQFVRLLLDLEDEALQKLVGSGALNRHDCVEAFAQMEEFCIYDESIKEAILGGLVMGSCDWDHVVGLARQIEDATSDDAETGVARQAALAPFRFEIDVLVRTWWSYAGGALGIAHQWLMSARQGALRRFLEDYAIQHGGLPAGKHLITFKLFSGEQSLEVDVDGLCAYAAERKSL